MDVTHQINAVERTVSNRILSTGEAHVLTLTQSFPTTQADLWDAVTTLDRIGRWFLPIRGNLELGGTYQFEGNAGGTIEACDPPNSFLATWEFGDQVSWITVTTSAIDDTSSRFTLEHVAHVDTSHWELYGPGAVGLGWDAALLGLALSLTAPGERPDDPLTWQFSDEGKQFNRLSADAWCAATIANNDDPEAARQAADTVYSLYTTAPE